MDSGGGVGMRRWIVLSVATLLVAQGVAGMLDLMPGFDTIWGNASLVVIGVALIAWSHKRQEPTDKDPAKAAVRRRGRWLSHDRAHLVVLDSREYDRRWDVRPRTAKEEELWQARKQALQTPVYSARRFLREEWPQSIARVSLRASQDICELILRDFATAHPDGYDSDRCRYHERTLRAWLAYKAESELATDRVIGDVTPTREADRRSTLGGG